MAVNKEDILRAMVDEIHKQAEDNRFDSPYVDLTNYHSVLIDGRVDLRKIAEAIHEKIRT